MNKYTNRYSKGNSPTQRSLTPTMLIESPQFTLANYKLMLKKAKTKPKAGQFSGLSSTMSLNKLGSVADSISSTDTCIFKNPSRGGEEEEEGDLSEAADLRARLREMQSFTKSALEAQKRYFEEVIWKLEEEINADKESFNHEIGTMRREIVRIREKNERRKDLEGLKDSEYKTQYLKNREFIKLLEKQNQLLYEKMVNK